MQPLTLDNLRKALGQIRESSLPKEVELVQFPGEPHFIAHQPSATKEEAGYRNANNSINIVNLPQDNPHLFASVRYPEDGAFASF